jgi:hypothetical protein
MPATTAAAVSATPRGFGNLGHGTYNLARFGIGDHRNGDVEIERLRHFGEGQGCAQGRMEVAESAWGLCLRYPQVESITGGFVKQFELERAHTVTGNAEYEVERDGSLCELYFQPYLLQMIDGVAHPVSFGNG